MKYRCILMISILLIIVLHSSSLTSFSIIVRNKSSRHIDIEKITRIISDIVNDYIDVFNLGLSKPLIVDIVDRCDYPCIAYTTERDNYYYIQTSSLWRFVLAHELVHIFQFEWYHNRLGSISWNGYEWYIESMADAIPIYLYNYSPIWIQYYSYNGIINKMLPMFLGGNRECYARRILFLWLFNHNVSCEQILKLKCIDNPFIELYPYNWSKMLVYFWLDNYRYVYKIYPQYHYIPRIAFSGSLYIKTMNVLNLSIYGNQSDIVLLYNTSLGLIPYSDMIVLEPIFDRIREKGFILNFTIYGLWIINTDLNYIIVKIMRK